MARKPNAKPPASELEGEDKTDDELIVVDDDETGTEQVNGSAVEESVEALRAKLDAETARREEAEQRARDAENKTTTAQAEVVDSNMQVIANALGKAEADKTAIKAKIIAAKEAGDYAAEADAVDELQTVNVKISRLNEGKSELERRIEEAKELPTDPVERYVHNMTPRAQQWIRAHSEVVTDPTKNAKLERSHFKALGQGIAQGSVEYFEFIEGEMGYTEKPQSQHVDEVRPNGQRPPAAPVSRSNNGSANLMLPEGVSMVGEGRYKLSPQRREAARISGLTDGEYLKHLLDLQKEGRAIN